MIGDIDRQVFLAIPVEGLDLLEWLSAGKTVGQAARLYEEKHAESADIEDFLQALEDEGFVGEADAVAAGDAPVVREAHWRFRLNWISPGTARRLVSWPVLTFCGVVIAAGLALAVDDPGVLPKGGSALLFPDHFAALFTTTVVLALLGVLLHEVGHVIAARAAGVPAGIGLGNQLWVLVAQTDMTAIWMAPKRQRYVAFVIGAIIDAVCSALLIGFIWSAHRGLVHPPEWGVLLAKAVMLTCMLRITWQLYFFVRTDGYYIIATAFSCKNLMDDTDDYLRNLWARVRRSPNVVDQSGIPKREMRVIRWYSVLWFMGRFISLVAFVVVVVPILWGYTYQLVLFLTGNHSRYNSLDFAALALVTLILDGGGLYMWFRGMFRGAKRRRERAARAKLRSESTPEPASLA
ncbi:hypothetical protein [Dactylosporangium sp. NPDC051541]|uniref:hypothetical protein n=1 Tax=Dactylosporangium sp. NPDC051541 TaxID=3363977 RepID=UPI0037925219